MKKAKNDDIDVKKLESLSLVSVDKEMVDKLINVIQIVDRMTNLEVKDCKPLIHYKYLG